MENENTNLPAGLDINYVGKILSLGKKNLQAIGQDISTRVYKSFFLEGIEEHQMRNLDDTAKEIINFFSQLAAESLTDIPILPMFRNSNHFSIGENIKVFSIGIWWQERQVTSIYEGNLFCNFGNESMELSLKDPRILKLNEFEELKQTNKNSFNTWMMSLHEFPNPEHYEEFVNGIRNENETISQSTILRIKALATEN